MANSTFSGPVRSQNGFQELVDGVWVPVGGGGGGVTLIPYTPGTNNYTLTGFTTPGDSATFAWAMHNPSGSDQLVIDSTVIPGTGGIIYVVTNVYPGDTPSDNSDFPTVQVFNDNAYTGIFTATYVGNIVFFSTNFAVIAIDATAFYL